MSIFDDIFGSGAKDPSKGAMKYLNQIPGTISPYYQPYINAGQGALNSLTDQSKQLTDLLPQLMSQYSSLSGMGPDVQAQYMKLMQDPTAVMNQIGQGYQASPGYNYQVSQATNAANKAAAAGGMLGSPQEQASLAHDITGMANQDYYNYINKGLSQYNTGLQGATGLFNTGLQGQQGLYNQGINILGDLNKYGYGASNELANALSNNLASMAQLKYAGGANQNMANSGAMSGIMGLLGMLGPSAINKWG